MEQYAEMKEKIDDDRSNPTNNNDEAEKADANHEKSDNDSDEDEGWCPKSFLKFISIYSLWKNLIILDNSYINNR